MPRIVPVLLIAVLLPVTGYSQKKFFTVFDTLKLNQVEVAYTVPLNDQSMVNHYQVLRTTSLDKINARLGGVSVISRGAYAMEPEINSFSGGQINVTIDGMKMFGACTGKMDPITSYVEPVNLKSIRLSHGSNGSSNGSTIGGSFDMLLQQPKLSEFSAGAGVNYESVSRGKTGYLVFNYGKERWAYRLSGVYKNYSSYTDGNGNTVPYSGYEKVNLQQSLLIVPAAGHPLTFDWLIDDAYNVGYPALPMDVSKARGRIYSVDYAPENSILNISNFKVKLYANTVYHVMDDSHRDSLYFIENSATGTRDSVYMHMDMPGRSNTYGGYAEGNIQWSGNNTLSFKVEDYLHWSKADMTMYMNNPASPGEPPMHTETWPKNQRHVTGLYLKNDNRVADNTLLSADLRVDYSNTRILSEQGIQQLDILGYNTGKVFHRLVKSANLNIDLHMGKSLKAKAGIGYGERLPTTSEQFGFYLFNSMDGYDYIGNPEIHSERAIHLWTSLSYTRPAIRISWENYYNHVFGYILGVAKPGYDALTLRASGVKEYENLRYAITFSTNMQVLWKPVPALEVFDVMKYNFGQMHTGQPLPLIQPFNNLLSVTWKKQKYYLQAESEYAAAQNRIDRNFGEIPSKQYLLLNFRSGYNLGIHKSVISLSFGVENILNKAYSEHLDWGTYNRPGRNVYAGVSWKL